MAMRVAGAGKKAGAALGGAVAGAELVLAVGGVLVVVVGLALGGGGGGGAALLLAMVVGLALVGAAVGLALAGAALLLMVGLALAGAALLLVVGLALLLVVGLALAGAEVGMKEDVCASSTSSPSEYSKNSFLTSSAIYVTDRVLKQLVKNLVFTFEFFSREKCAVLRVIGFTLSLSFISSATTHLPLRSTGMAPCCFV